ncbi:MAG: hypothetical protein KAR56_00945 [Thermoplasmata archaeon]|nr:hypothetical protein [Thermoplasmata archaeon]
MTDDLRLKVVTSSINGKGIAKLDCDSFSKLKLSDGMKIIVTYGTKSKEMSAKQDLIYLESTARLMRLDLKYLRIEDGMKVIITRKNDPKPIMKPVSKGKKGKKTRGKAASLDSF